MRLNMKSILLLLCSIAACNAFQSLADEWASFKATHGKSYASQKEEQRRLNIYLENKQLIEEHNVMYEQGLVSYKLGMNHFGDMLEEEMIPYHNGINKSIRLNSHENVLHISNLSLPMFKKLPLSVDWRDKGYVTPVKNQENCASCWSFSTTGVLESQLFRKTGRLVSLSEQNLIDCAAEGQGCIGWDVLKSYEYIMAVGGLNSEADYPYKATSGKVCKYNNKKIAISISGYHVLPANDENSLMEAVALQGPISVSITVSPYKKFKLYSSGVYSDPSCDPFTLNHAVLLVGYGTTESGQEYWLIKNSWGAKWGDHGYMKMARNAGNMCGIAREASYPIVK